MNWSPVNSNPQRIRFAKGKYFSYAIFRGTSEAMSEKKEEYVVKLYSFPDDVSILDDLKRLTILDLKQKKRRKELRLEDKKTLWGNRPPQHKIDEVVTMLMKEADKLEDRYSQDPNLCSPKSHNKDDWDEE